MWGIVRIENETAWRTDHLRAFVQRALVEEEVPVATRRRLCVIVGYGRGPTWPTARSWSGAANAVLHLFALRDQEAHKSALAQVLLREAAHIRGRDYNDIVIQWSEDVPWASALPLERRPERAAPATTADERRMARFRHAAVMAKRWKRKLAQAETWCRKWQRRAARLHREVNKGMAGRPR